jgi:hypothetical protein
VSAPQQPRGPRLVAGVDYYLEGPNMVFTAHYLLKRGYCCNSGCRHCPYKDGAEVPNVAVEVIAEREDDDLNE